ncbi:hypothetical protein SASPL_130634 [Salvia splendens]|uniref:Solute carrier family 15 (Peptide/histidine transporter), member 3/4 n=1 Tax=Salvia splendens TaxID=180675 RepID=A0A8X8ZK75_SALSN|nr:hypothetical protein SASPL_130634 [Salvia splendens]
MPRMVCSNFVGLTLNSYHSMNGSDGLYTGNGSVDFKGNPVLKSKTGNWRACPFILGTECCERLAYYGIATNLVSYLTKNLHQGNVSAATTWQGTCYLTPLSRVVLADAYWGRYWTIAAFSTLYFIIKAVLAVFGVGMCTLTASATIPYFKPPECVDSVCPSASTAQYAVFFFWLYLVALVTQKSGVPACSASVGTGGIKPCVSSFGADHFDDTDPVESVKKGSVFSWFYFSINIGALVSSSLIVWIQDNAGWGPLVPETRRKPYYKNVSGPDDSNLLYELPDKSSAIQGSRKLLHTDELKCLDKAAVISEAENERGDYSNAWSLCTVTQVEELKILICMFPIWATGIVFAAVYAQMSTMFVEQGMVMDTAIGSFTIPAASLSTFDVISVIFWVPMYDRVLVPVAKMFTGKDRGFTELQRMGVGLFLSILCMSAAAIVEIFHTAVFLLGAAEVFTFIGQPEFFYDQSPDAMRSLCTALSLLTTALGNYLSSFILTVVTSLTTQGGQPGWIPDNLNICHLDYFFWLLAALSFFNLVVLCVLCENVQIKECIMKFDLCILPLRKTCVKICKLVFCRW